MIYFFKLLHAKIRWVYKWKRTELDGVNTEVRSEEIESEMNSYKKGKAPSPGINVELCKYVDKR